MLAQKTSTPLAQDDAYAQSGNYSKALSAEVLQASQEFRRRRLERPDMITTDAAAEIVGTTRVTINTWIKSGRCIGVEGLTRGFKLPVWQFEPMVWPAVQGLSKNLGTKDGWTLLHFMETPIEALDGNSPLKVLEHGLVEISRILQLAQAEAH